MLELSPHPGGVWGSAVPMNLMGEVAIQRGALTEAEDWFRRSLDVTEQAESRGFPGPMSYAWHGLGEIAFAHGDLAAATAWYRHARHLARRCGAPDIEALAPLSLVRTYLLSLPTGALRPAAKALLERGCAVATRCGFSLAIVRAALLEAEAYMRWGTLAEARAKAEEALHYATTVGRKREEALARRLLGQCAQARGAYAESEVHLRAALALLTEMGAALEVARTRALLAETLAAQADGEPIPAEARALPSEALVQFTASRAALDLARAEQMAVSWRERSLVRSGDDTEHH